MSCVRPLHSPSFASRLCPVWLGLSLTGVLGAVGASHAANAPTKLTTGTELRVPGAWSTGSLPSVTHDAVLTASAATTYTLSGAAGLTVGSLNYQGAFASTLGNAIASTTGTLTLGGAGNLGNGLPAKFATDLFSLPPGGTLTLQHGAGTLALALGQEGTFNTLGTLNLFVPVTGAFGLEKTGAGTLTLAAANTYTGATTVNGPLTLDFSLPSAPATGGIIASGATSPATATPLVLKGATLTLRGRNAATSTQYFNGTTLAAGGSRLTLTQNGAATLTAALGAITRQAGGALNVSPVPAATGVVATTATLNDATGLLGPWATVGSGTTLQYAAVNAAGQIVPYTGATTDVGNLASLTDPAGNYVYGAPATVAANATAHTLRYTGAATTTALGTSTLTLNGFINAGTGAVTLTRSAAPGGVTIGDRRELVVSTAGQGISFNVPIANHPAGPSSVVVTGTSPVNLNVANPFSGGLTVANTAAGGRVVFPNVAAALGTGTITLAGGGVVTGAGNYNLYSSTGAVALPHPFVIVTGTQNRFEFSQNGTWALNGSISGGGLFALSSGFAPTLQLGGDLAGFTGLLQLQGNGAGNGTQTTSYDFTNPTTPGVPHGRVQLAPGANPGTNGTSAGNVAALRWNPSATTSGTLPLGELSSLLLPTQSPANALLVNAKAGTTVLWRIGALNTDATFGGNIVANVGAPTAISALQKVGTGTLTLSGANTYTGPTTVTAGALLINGTFASVATVETGVLGGTGTSSAAVIVGDTTGTADARLAPGGPGATGTFTTAAATTFNADGVYAFEFNSTAGTADQLRTHGLTLAPATTLTLAELAPGPLAPGTVFTLVDNTSSAPVTGTFSGLAEGAEVVGAGKAFVLSYTGGTGNDLTLTLLATPEIVSAAATTGVTGSAFAYTIEAGSQSPIASYGATGLPAGLAVDTTTGVISGTPAGAGVSNVTVSATNAAGTSSQAVTIVIEAAQAGAPALTSPATAGGAVAAAFGYATSASNHATSFAASGLPPGLALAGDTGLISGTPTTVGTWKTMLSATNAAGLGTAVVTFTITPAVPVITSAAAATATVEAPFLYQITATQTPASFGATGLPPGLAVDAATGAISGTPIAAGTWNATISAINDGVVGSAVLAFTIGLPPAPVITSAAAVTGNVATPFSYALTFTNTATSFSASGLPAGLSMNPATGLITGTPDADGTSSATLTATNAGGSASLTVAFTIKVALPVITSARVAGGRAGTPFSYTITATQSPTGFEVGALPAGLVFDAATGVISGAPEATATTPVTVEVTNPGGVTTFTLSIDITVFTHPGVPLTRQDLDQVKARLHLDPYKSGYALLVADGRSQLGYVMRGPFAEVSRAPHVRRNEWISDMQALHNLTLMWYFTKNPAYGQKARDILLAWAHTHTAWLGNEAMLDIGDYSYRLFTSASLLRGTWPGWTQADTDACKAYFNNVYWPALAVPKPVAMANQGSLTLAGAIGVAVFNDDLVKFNQVLFAFRGDANAGIQDVMANGQVGDSGRDQGHAFGQLFSTVWTAEVFWKQGVDVYSLFDHRLHAAGEFYGRYNVGAPTLYVPFGATYDLYLNHGGAPGSSVQNRIALNVVRGAFTTRQGLATPYADRFLASQPEITDSFAYIKSVDPTTAVAPGPIALPAMAAVTTGLADADIGTPALPGGSSYGAGTWTVSGSGNELTGANDSFHYAYQPVSGDCVMIARVTGLQNTAAGAKAGLMLRETLAAGSRRMFIALTPAPNPTYYSQITGATASSKGILSINHEIPGFPYWVKLERLGQRLTTYTSPDGVSWSPSWVGDFATLGSSAYLGLAVCSANNAALTTATFTDVHLTGGDGGAPLAIPAAPLGIYASPGDSEVPLRWFESFKATSYTVKRATSPGGPFTTIATGLTGNRTVDTTVTNGVTYHYVVSATNAAGESADSPADLVTPERAMINVATGGVATASSASPTETAARAFDGNPGTKWNLGITGTSAWLQYDLGAGVARTVTRYAVGSANDVPGRDPKDWTFQGSHDGSTWTTLDAQNGQTFLARHHQNHYPIANTTPYRHYRLDIAASNGATSLQLSEITLMVSLDSPETAPTAPGATIASPTTVDLAWNGVPWAETYEVKRATTAGGPYTVIARDLLAPAYADTAVTTGTTYYYVISGRTRQGETADSVEVSATPHGPPPLITSASTATGGYGMPFSYTITATNNPLSFAATGLPPGLVLDPATGVISGTPQAAGEVTVTLTATSPGITGPPAVLRLAIAPASVAFAFSSLVQPYDGTPRGVTTTSTLAGIEAVVTYDGVATPPLYPGDYTIVATATGPNHTGTATDTLTITVTALVRHAPTLNADLDGSLQMLTAENVTLNSSAAISGDLLTPGTPSVQLNGTPTYGSTLEGPGAAAPAGYTVTLNTGSVLRHVVGRVDPLTLPAVAAPPAPAGTRDVSLNTAGQAIGDPTTLRDLTFNSGAGSRTVPAGTYGNVTVHGGTLVLGVAGATEPAAYNLQNLVVNSGGTVQVVGPVTLTVASGVTFNADVGTAGHPEWLTLRVAAGGVTLNTGVRLHGHVIAPHGTVTLNNATLHGTVASDRLTLDGTSLLDDPTL